MSICILSSNGKIRIVIPATLCYMHVVHCSILYESLCINIVKILYNNDHHSKGGLLLEGHWEEKMREELILSYDTFVTK